MISALVEYLAMFYQTGNLVQVEAITRSLLAAIPDDIVALQFLGLALYQMGRDKDAYQAFKDAAARLARPAKEDACSVCEPARAVTYREATRANSGLADGWHRIALVLKNFGFPGPAARAFEAESAARGPTIIPAAGNPAHATSGYGCVGFLNIVESLELLACRSSENLSQVD